MTTLPTLPADVLVKIDQVAQLGVAQSICHYDTTAAATKIIREVFAQLGPGGMIPIAQKMMFEKMIAGSMTLGLDLEKAVEFCKSVAHLAN